MRRIIQKSMGWYFSRKSAPYWLVLICDSAMVVVSGILASAIFKGPEATGVNFWMLIVTWCFFLIAYFIGFRICRTYSGVLRYSSFVDLTRVAFANLIGIIIIYLLRHFTTIPYLLGLVPISWQELAISFVIATALMWAERIMVKYLYDLFIISSSAQRVFIYGTKAGGVGLAKSIRSQDSQYVVSGFISDDEEDWQHQLMGVKIYPNDQFLVDK
ncbi:MAG: polysaccharide biosynthesis protein, partial [Bacteroidales bacterium]|nr:polysaccharide biosynthesis protein [Bacteroidales bacterium]